MAKTRVQVLCHFRGGWPWAPFLPCGASALSFGTRQPFFAVQVTRGERVWRHQRPRFLPRDFLTVRAVSSPGGRGSERSATSEAAGGWQDRGSGITGPWCTSPRCHLWAVGSREPRFPHLHDGRNKKEFRCVGETGSPGICTAGRFPEEGNEAQGARGVYSGHTNGCSFLSFCSVLLASPGLPVLLSSSAFALGCSFCRSCRSFWAHCCPPGRVQGCLFRFSVAPRPSLGRPSLTTLFVALGFFPLLVSFSP